MLRDLTELILPNKRRPHVCEACGQPFVCGASLKGCWCSQIELTEEVRTRLRERYRDCLCRECLTRFAAEDATFHRNLDEIDQWPASTER